MSSKQKRQHHVIIQKRCYYPSEREVVLPIYLDLREKRSALLERARSSVPLRQSSFIVE